MQFIETADAHACSLFHMNITASTSVTKTKTEAMSLHQGCACGLCCLATCTLSYLFGSYTDILLFYWEIKVGVITAFLSKLDHTDHCSNIYCTVNHKNVIVWGLVSINKHHAHNTHTHTHTLSLPLPVLQAAVHFMLRYT